MLSPVAAPSSAALASGRGPASIAASTRNKSASVDDGTLESIIGSDSTTSPGGTNAPASGAAAADSMDQTLMARQAITGWLQFRDSRLEQLYQIDYFVKYIRVVRRSIVIGTSLWALFVINDILKEREGKRRNFAATVSLRFGVIGLALVALGVTYLGQFGRKSLSWLVATVLVFFGAAQVVCGVIETDTTDPTYSVAILVIASTSSAFFRLPCMASVFCNITMYLVYVIVTITTGAYDTLTHYFTTCMWLLIGIAVYSLHAYDREWYIRSSYLAQRRLEYEEHKSQRVLLKMLPLSVIEQLRSGAEFMHERHSNISVLFSHICEFDEHTSSMSPNEVIGLLNQIFSRFDAITDEYGVYKVETIGDVYLYPRFRLMGDTVNTASRMSSTCQAGDIQLTPMCFHQLHPDEFIVQYRGEIQVKGKGLMKTYLVRGRVAKPDTAATAAAAAAAAQGSTPATLLRGLFSPGPNSGSASSGGVGDVAGLQTIHATNSLRSPAGAAILPGKTFSAAQIAQWTDGQGDQPAQMPGGTPTEPLPKDFAAGHSPALAPAAAATPAATASFSSLSSEEEAAAANFLARKASVRVHLPGHKSRVDGGSPTLSANGRNSNDRNVPRGASQVQLEDSSASTSVVPEFVAPSQAGSPVRSSAPSLAGSNGTGVTTHASSLQQALNAITVHPPSHLGTASVSSTGSAGSTPLPYPDDAEIEPLPGMEVKPSGKGIHANEVIRLTSMARPAGSSGARSLSAVGKKSPHSTSSALLVLGRKSATPKDSGAATVSTDAYVGGANGTGNGASNGSGANGNGKDLQAIGEDDDDNIPALNSGKHRGGGSNASNRSAGDASGLVSPTGGKDVLRITAKDAQMDSSLFNSNLEFDALTDTSNPLQLRFIHAPALEAEFQEDFFRKFLEPNRRGLLSFIVALLLLGIYETLINLPETDSESYTMAVTWVLRLGGLCFGLGLYTLTFTHRAWYARWQQPVLTLVWGLMGIVLISIFVQFDTYEEVYGVTCLLLLLTMTSTFVGLQFIWVTLVTIFFILWYIGSALVVYQSFPLVVFFLLASNVLAITASRSSEYYLRWDFIRHLKLQNEERRTRHFLDNMLPRSVIAEIKLDHRFIAHEFLKASVLFSDIVSFTLLASRIQPEDVVAILNVMFSTFDALTTKHNVYKVETIGDAYLACSNVVHRSPSATEDLVRFALDLQTSTRYMHTPDGQPIVIRIGIHTGSVVAGVVGRKMPRYHLFGETVTVAEEMEQNGIPNHVVISAATHAECEGYFEVEKLEPIHLHAKPAKNILNAEALAASIAAQALSHTGADESRLVHRYKVIAYMGALAPFRGNGALLSEIDGSYSMSPDSTAQAGSGPPGLHRGSIGGASSSVTGGLSRMGESSANLHLGSEMDRAPPPFVANILGKINARNFAENHARLERNQARIASSLAAAQSDMALRRAPSVAHQASSYDQAPNADAAAAAAAASGSSPVSAARVHEQGDIEMTELPHQDHAADAAASSADGAAPAHSQLMQQPGGDKQPSPSSHRVQ